MLDIDGPNTYLSTVNSKKGVMTYTKNIDDHFFYGAKCNLRKNVFKDFNTMEEVKRIRKPKKIFIF